MLQVDEPPYFFEHTGVAKLNSELVSVYQVEVMLARRTKVALIVVGIVIALEVFIALFH